MKVLKNDNVLIIAGKDKGKTGKVIKSFPKDMQVLVEGVNVKKKHVKPKKEGEKGQVLGIPAPVDISNVQVICPKCGKAARIGYQIDKDSKKRICKQCKQPI